MTSRPARPRTLLDFINRPILKGVAPAGNLTRVFTGKLGQNRKKNFGRVMYASDTIQNLKNPTGHIDTLIQDIQSAIKGTRVAAIKIAHNSFHLSTAPRNENDNISIFLACWVVSPCEL